MKCQNCGGYIKRRDTYCPRCGMKVQKSKYKPQQKSKNSEYKPLQQRYMRGEYQDSPNDFYDQYMENQYIEENQYIDEEPTYQKHKKKKYRGYDLSEYYPEEEETENSGSGTLIIVLILLIALLIGFVIGLMMFTNSSLTSIG